MPSHSHSDRASRLRFEIAQLSLSMSQSPDGEGPINRARRRRDEGIMLEKLTRQLFQLENPGKLQHAAGLEETFRRTDRGSSIKGVQSKHTGFAISNSGATALSRK